MYSWFQWTKDFCAIPVFILMSLETQPHYFLAAFFSIGCFIDTIFSAYAYWYDNPWTIARIKDAMGAFGMWIFALALIAAKPVHDSGRWSYFFCFATVVDMVSVFSILCVQNSIYLKFCF